MAVITKINGVDTTGTVGINNIFGSGGGGGTPNVTPTPTQTGLAATTYGGNEFLLSNSLSYTNPTFKLTVEDPNGTVVVDNDFTTEETAGFYIIRWTGAGAAGTHTVTFQVQEFGDYYDSAELTLTYTKLAAEFQYWRIYGTDSAGSPVAAHMGIREWELWTGAGATGSVHPNGNMTAPSNSASDEPIGNASVSGYIAERGHTAFTYPAWYAFDGNFTGQQAWTLGASAANNWIEIQFDVGSTEFPTTGDIPEIRSHKVRNYAGDSAAYYTIKASTTGAFSGEEIDIAIIDAASNSDTTYTV